MTVVNSGTVDKKAQISLQDPAFNSVEHVPTSGIAALYGIPIFKF